jgi:hypothetical protein
VKQHIERRDNSGKTLCGIDLPEGFTAWSDHESCERCGKIQDKAEREGAKRSVTEAVTAKPDIRL